MSLSLFRELKGLLEEAAFLVSRSSFKEAHAQIVKALVLTSRLEDEEQIARPTAGSRSESGVSMSTRSGQGNAPTPENDETSSETKKVRNRLRLWSRRPQQINTRILRAYLELERSGVSPITEPLLRSAMPSELPFDSNFAQMKIIAERNHGKVFDIQGGRIFIWPPVEPYVREFERDLFPASTGQSTPFTSET